MVLISRGLYESLVVADYLITIVHVQRGLCDIEIQLMDDKADVVLVFSVGNEFSTATPLERVDSVYRTTLRQNQSLYLGDQSIWILAVDFDNVDSSSASPKAKGATDANLKARFGIQLPKDWGLYRGEVWDALH